MANTYLAKAIVKAAVAAATLAVGTVSVSSGRKQMKNAQSDFNKFREGRSRNK